MRDDAAATVIGAIVVLAVLGIALVYVNAYHVPQQGEARELLAAQAAASALAGLATKLAAPAEGPVVGDLPLAPARTSPPLLAGVVLSPVRALGQAELDATSSTLRISTLLPVPEGGVPPDDPTRVPAGDRMRVYLVGNATAGQSLGALRVQTGGAYFGPAAAVMEAGAVHLDTTAGSAGLAAPSLAVSEGTSGTAVSWRVPFLAGTARPVSAEAAQAVLAPGPAAHLGGSSRVEEVRIEIATERLAAWETVLASIVGAHGTVSSAPTGEDSGTVTATILDAALDLYVVRYDVSLNERN